METHETHFVHASDEWYLLAEQPLPDEDNYDGYIQLENGVGMLRLLIDEFHDALELLEQDMAEEEVPEGMLPDTKNEHHVTLVTGKLPAPFLAELAEECERRFPNYHIDVVAIRNDVFGEMITVSGLLTGQDILAQLKELKEAGKLGERVLLPCNLLRSGEETLLDDMTVTELSEALDVQIDIVGSGGSELLNSILNI